MKTDSLPQPTNEDLQSEQSHISGYNHNKTDNPVSGDKLDNRDICDTNCDIDKCKPTSNERTGGSMEDDSVRENGSQAELSPILALPVPQKESETGRTKSPVTVHEWVATLQEHHGLDDELPGPITVISTQEDTLHLGAEAGELSLSSLRGDEKVCSLLSRGRDQLSRLHDTCDSMQSDETSVSSHSSIDSLLQARQEDPEELLYSLGFGSGDDNFVRIPDRFLMPSRVPGIDIQRFLELEEARLDTMETGLGGFSGILEGYAQQISPIVSNILEIMCEQNKEERRRQSQTSMSTPARAASFRELTSRMMTKSSVLDLLKRSNTVSGTTTTILDPANKEFLDKQGRLSPRPTRKIVLGSDTYDLDKDGSIIESESDIHPTHSPPIIRPLPFKPSELSRNSSKMSFMSSISDSDDEDPHTQATRAALASDVFAGRRLSFPAGPHKTSYAKHCQSSFQVFKRFPGKRSSSSSISSWESDRTPCDNESTGSFPLTREPVSDSYGTSVQPILEESMSVPDTEACASDSSDDKTRHISESQSELSTTSSRTNLHSEGSESDDMSYEVNLRRTRSVDITDFSRPKLQRQKRVSSVDDDFLFHKPKLERQGAVDHLWPLESGEVKQLENIPDNIPEIEISSCSEERSASAQSDSSGFHEDDEKSQGLAISWPPRRSSCDSSVSDETVRLLDPHRLDVCESDTCTLTPDVGMSDNEVFVDASPKPTDETARSELESRLSELDAILKPSDEQEAAKSELESRLSDLAEGENSTRTKKMHKSKSEPWDFYSSEEPPQENALYVSRKSIELIKQVSLGEDKGYNSASSEVSNPKFSPASRSFDEDSTVQQRSGSSEEVLPFSPNAVGIIALFSSHRRK